jgi:hypothetical protein
LAYFYVPKVAGIACNVSEPVEAQPLDWLVPESCNISGDYENTTLLLHYYTSEEIPAVSSVTLNINEVRNPLQLANCSGWFDLQIQQQFDLGWMIVGRTVVPCQFVPTAGPSQIFVNFSNLRAGWTIKCFDLVKSETDVNNFYCVLSNLHSFTYFTMLVFKLIFLIGLQGNEQTPS